MHTPLPLHPWKHPIWDTLCLFSPPNNHVIKLSVQNQQRTNKWKIALQQKEKHKAVIRGMTANIVRIVNFRDLNVTCEANIWLKTQCLKLSARKACTESINIKDKADAIDGVLGLQHTAHTQEWSDK